MHEYEIKFINSDHSLSVVFETWQLDDAAAICTAKRFTGDRAFEVWQGMECICHGTSEVPSMNGERAAR
jgi:hypothetical protein